MCHLSLGLLSDIFIQEELERLNKRRAEREVEQALREEEEARMR